MKVNLIFFLCVFCFFCASNNKHWPSRFASAKLNSSPLEQNKRGNLLCMSVKGKSGGEAGTAASPVLSVHESPHR